MSSPAISSKGLSRYCRTEVLFRLHSLFFSVGFRVHFSRETKLCKNQNSFATIEGVS